VAATEADEEAAAKEAIDICSVAAIEAAEDVGVVGRRCRECSLARR
jgi:hypothetical protein